MITVFQLVENVQQLRHYQKELWALVQEHLSRIESDYPAERFIADLWTDIFHGQLKLYVLISGDKVLHAANKGDPIPYGGGLAGFVIAQEIVDEELAGVLQVVAMQLAKDYADAAAFKKQFERFGKYVGYARIEYRVPHVLVNKPLRERLTAIGGKETHSVFSLRGEI